MPGRRTSQMVAAISSRGTASGGGLIVALLACHLAAPRGGFLAAASCGPAPFQALQDGWADEESGSWPWRAGALVTASGRAAARVVLRVPAAHFVLDRAEPDQRVVGDERDGQVHHHEYGYGPAGRAAMQDVQVRQPEH
jgi:hypothetical protein